MCKMSAEFSAARWHLRFAVPNDAGIPYLLKNKKDAEKKIANLFVKMAESKIVDHGTIGAASSSCTKKSGKRGRSFTDVPDKGHLWAQDMLKAVFHVVDKVPPSEVPRGTVEQAFLWCLELGLAGSVKADLGDFKDKSGCENGKISKWSVLRSRMQKWLCVELKIKASEIDIADGPVETIVLEAENKLNNIVEANPGFIDLAAKVLVCLKHCLSVV